MKAALEFNLPEEHGDFECAVKGRDAIAVLLSFSELLRGRLKHGGTRRFGDEECEVLRDALCELMAERCLEETVFGDL